MSLYCEAGPFSTRTAPHSSPCTFQNERTRVVERAFRSSPPLPRSGSTIRHAFTANVAHGASGSNGRTYRVSGWQDDTRNPPEHLVGRRLPPIAQGWARAGIKNVELTNNLLDEFLKSDSLPAAKRVLTDLGLTPVSSACGVFGLWEPNPKRAAQLDAFKKRCEQFASLGLTKIYSPTPTTEKFTEEDYKRGVANMRENGDIAKQFGMVVMAEAVRTSTFIGTLPTMLKMMREAAHPSVAPLLDFYHFWSGLNKLEDLDQIRQGEIGTSTFRTCPTCHASSWTTPRASFPAMASRRSTGCCARLRTKATPGPCPSNCSCPNSSKAILTKSLARSVRRPKRSCAARASCDLSSVCQSAPARDIQNHTVTRCIVLNAHIEVIAPLVEDPAGPLCG